MERRDALKLMPAVLALGAVPASAQVNQADPRTFTVHSTCQGFVIVENGPEDYSLRMVAADGNGSLKFLRYTGPDALAELSDIYRMLTFLGEKFGVPID